MKPVARFITRANDGEPVNLIIGSGFKSAGNSLKANTVYEIVECLGELVIKEVGPSIVKNPTDPTREIGLNWGCDFQSIVTDHGGTHLLTEQEYKQQCNTIHGEEDNG